MTLHVNEPDDPGSGLNIHLYYEGLSAPAVKLRRPGVLATLRRHGYTIDRPSSTHERAQGCALLNEHVPGLTVPAGTLTADRIIVARHRATGAIHGAADVGTESLKRWTLGRIRALAVLPDQRGKSLGLGLLHETPRLLRSGTLALLYGSCPEDQAPFYGRAGFYVTTPGQLLPLPSGDAAKNINKEAPCWFFRQP